MGNLRKTINVRLVNNAKDYKRWIGRPNFVSQIIFDKNFVAIHEIKPVLTLAKPIYVEFSILDLSKYLMYDFHYKYIKRKHDAKLLFTDKGSLVYEIKKEDFYEDFYKDKNLFDFSDYLQDSKFFDLDDKSVFGKIRDKSKGKIIREFLGLRSKMYSLIAVDSREIKKEKAVNKNVVKNIRHEEYISVLFNKKMISWNMKKFKINYIELEVIISFFVLFWW